jgi:hypothetical protein
MTLSNMREQGVYHLIAFCHNDVRQHQALIDVPSYPPETPVSLKQFIYPAPIAAFGARMD